MAEGHKIYKRCDVCQGTGLRPNYSTEGSGSEVCNQCGGEGLFFFGWMTKEEYEMPEITLDIDQ